MSTEKAREDRLRRLAEKDGEIFVKVRSPYQMNGVMVHYELVDAHTGNLLAYWECLEDAEVAIKKTSPA